MVAEGKISLVKVRKIFLQKFIIHCFSLSNMRWNKAAFYKLSNKDETKYAEATSAATNISFQYNICLYQLTLNYNIDVAAEQHRIKMCSRISRAT